MMISNMILIPPNMVKINNKIHLKRYFFKLQIKFLFEREICFVKILCKIMAIQVGEKIVFTFVVIILIASVSVEFVSFKAVATAFPLSVCNDILIYYVIL